MHPTSPPTTIPYTTILAQPPTTTSPPSTHPLFYYEHRNTFLSTLSDKYSSKYRLPTMDLRRNVRVDYLMGQYERARQEVEREDRRDRCYLGVEEFQTVFGDCIGERRERRRERMEEERLRRDLQRYYLHEEETHEQPEKDIEDRQQPSTGYKTILTDYRSDPQTQKQLYLLDLQIGKLQLQSQLQQKIISKHNSCQNEQLLSKLSNNILSAYLINFDQIYTQLIDEILTQEVYYLNYMEAQYKIQKAEWNHGVDEDKVRFQDARTIRMMEVVRGLEDLCDQ